MGDRHDRARVLLEEALEPGHRLGVEMVGGLVQQQHVRLLQQQPAQRHAAPLAAGDLGDLGVARRHAQRVHRQLDRAIEIPRVDRVDLVLQARLLLEQLLHLVVAERLAQLGAHFLEAREQGARLGHALLDVAPHVLVRVERRLLGEIADAQPVGGERLAQEVVVDPGHDAQERGLAGAVGAEHADLGAVKERQIDAAQDLPLGRDDLAQVLHRERVLTSHRARYCTMARRERHRHLGVLPRVGLLPGAGRPAGGGGRGRALLARQARRAAAGGGLLLLPAGRRPRRRATSTAWRSTNRR